MKAKNLTKTNKLNTVDYIKHAINDNILVKGGRKNGVKQLNKVKEQKKYNTNRNTLGIETSLLSAYIKFGCISIREVYWKVKDKLGTSNSLLSNYFGENFILHYILFTQVLKGKTIMKSMIKLNGIKVK